MDKADCYSDGERQVMLGYQGIKQRLLHPLLIVLDRCGVTPNVITWISVVIGLAFVPSYLWMPGATGLLVAHLLLFAHLLIDGVDGPLARFQNRASAAGSLTDTFGDQMVVVAVSLTYAVAESYGRAGLHPVSAAMFAISYNGAVGMAMVRNAMGIPFRFLLRPRNFFYGLMWFDAYGWWGDYSPVGVEVSVWIFNAALMAAVVLGFLAIRTQLASRDKEPCCATDPSPVNRPERLDEH